MEQERKERLLRALEAARRAGNVTLVQSVLCALEGSPRGVKDVLPDDYPDYLFM